MQCEICRKPTTEYETMWITYSTGEKHIHIAESNPVYYVNKNNRQYKCCKECWKKN